jgi:hypothetical protein
MIIPVGFAQVNIVFGGLAMPRGAQVTYGVLNTGLAGTPYTAPQLAEFVKETWRLRFLTQQSSSCVLKEARVKLGPNATGPDATVSVNHPGLQSAESDSPNVAVLIRKRTPFGGKKGKGRMFLPGVHEGATNKGGVIDTAYLNLVQAEADQWLDAHDAGGASVQLLHSAIGLAPFVVTDLEVQQLMATQRRRLR